MTLPKSLTRKKKSKLIATIPKLHFEIKTLKTKLHTLKHAHKKTLLFYYTFLQS